MTDDVCQDHALTSAFHIRTFLSFVFDGIKNKIIYVILIAQQ